MEIINNRFVYLICHVTTCFTDLPRKKIIIIIKTGLNVLKNKNLIKFLKSIKLNSCNRARQGLKYNSNYF